MFCVGALLCVFGFAIAMIVSTLINVKTRQQGPVGAVTEKSRKMVSEHEFCLSEMETIYIHQLLPATLQREERGWVPSWVTIEI